MGEGEAPVAIGSRGDGAGGGRVQEEGLGKSCDRSHSPNLSFVLLPVSASKFAHPLELCIVSCCLNSDGTSVPESKVFS